MVMGAPSKPAKVFISYALQDDKLREQLEEHLALLKRQALIETWHRRKIPAGAEQQDVIDAELEAADLILLLVSPSFIDSDYLYGSEMMRALKRHEARQARVIPVIVRPCDWTNAPFSLLRALPADGRAVTIWPNHDEAWVDVTTAIRAVLDTPAGVPSGGVPARHQPVPAPADSALHQLRSSPADFTRREEEHADLRARPGPSGSIIAELAIAMGGPAFGDGVTATGSAQIGTPPNTLPKRRIFIGRDEEMMWLRQALRNGQRAMVTQSGQTSLFGLGGVGKTALALEFAHRHVLDYPGGIWWVRAEGTPAETMVRLAADLRRLGRPYTRDLLARERSDAPAEDIARAVQLALQNQREPALLVLDNVESNEWYDYLPGGQVQIIATTRDRRLALGEPAPLDVLPMPTARDLACVIAGQPESVEDAEALERVLKELGMLAVAVEMAARAVKIWFRRWTLYEDRMRSEMERLLEEPDVYGEYRRGVFAALDLSIDRCEIDSPEHQLLEATSMFAPDGIPVEWAESVANLGLDDTGRRKALSRLVGLGLVAADDTFVSLSIHRLVHARVRKRALNRGHDAMIELRKRALSCIAAWLLNTVDPTMMGEIERFDHHIHEALRVAEQAQLDFYWILIANSYSSYLRYRALYRDAQTLLEHSLSKAEALPRSNPVIVAMCLSNLATTHREFGNLAEAQKLQERAISCVEASGVSDHPLYASELTQLAAVLYDLGRADEARSLLERSLKLNEPVQDQPRPEDAKRLSNLALVLQELGRPADALPVMERALEISSTIYGTEHPNFATALSNMAIILRDVGCRTEARELFEESLRIVESTYGPEHPMVAKALTNLGSIYQDVGQLQQARLSLERAIDIDTKNNPNHPDVGTRLSNLAAVLHELDDLEGACRLFERALEHDEVACGGEHPRIAICLQNLALVRRDAGDLKEARLLLDRAIAIDEKTYGPDHPSVAYGLSNMGMVLSDLGHHADARCLLERALKIFESVYGLDHPSVADCLTSLATTLYHLGEVEAACRLLKRAIAMDESTESPSCAKAIIRLTTASRIFRDLGRPKEAHQHLKRAVEIAKEGFGTDHPRVADALTRLAICNLQMLKRPGTARLLLEQAQSIAKQHMPPSHALRVEIAQILAAIPR
jgi:tetratricopeptide (TPR) repeat protein